MEEENNLENRFEGGDSLDKDLMEKIREYKDAIHKSDQLDEIALRMYEQLDSMITSNRETIRMKCLEAALKYCEITKWEVVKEREVIALAEKFYKFVKGE